jgi:DNA-binding protein YbaB
MTSLADGVVARIVRQRDLVQALDERLQSIVVRVTSRDRSVCVEVDGLGAMTGLWLGPNAYRDGADALAVLVVDTATAAADEAAARQRSLLDEFDQQMRDVGEQPLTGWGGETPSVRA